MNYIQKITRVRERGQLTVPYEIREALNWYDEELTVKIETTPSGFRVERVPISHPQHPKKKLTKEEGEKIWEDMKRISKLGKQGVNLTKFLRHDRDTHF
jgi:bifunctional DNA-binding transcriptional regulator/antitoxin component of YhaV-PrlF toxin-antitoxin module